MVIVSGSTNPERAAEAIASGATAYIGKHDIDGLERELGPAAA